MAFNSFFYRLSGRINLFSPQYLSRISRQSVIFPFYHIVSDKNVPHVKHLYSIRSSKQFENDLDFMLTYFNPISVDDLERNYFTDKRGGKPSFLLTFDDGLREFYDVIAPVLLKKGIPAVNFLNSAFVDNQDLFYRYKFSLIREELSNRLMQGKLKGDIQNWFREKELFYDEKFESLNRINYINKSLLDELSGLLNIRFEHFLRNEKPYMSSEQITELIEKGFVFGAHSIDHPEYALISLEEQIRQTRESMNFVAEQFKQKYKLFSFPFTDHLVSKQFFEILFKKNNQVVDYTFGTAGLKKDGVIKNIQRIPIEKAGFSANQVIMGEFYYFLFKSIFRKNRIKRN